MWEIRDHIYNPYIKSKTVFFLICIVCNSRKKCHSVSVFKKFEVLHFFHILKYKAAIYVNNVFSNLFPTNVSSHFTHIYNVYSTQHKIHMFNTQEQRQNVCVLDIYV